MGGSRLLLGVLALGLIWALGEEVFRPEVELLRGERRVKAWVSGEEGSLFYADYGEVLVGPLEALEAGWVQVGGRRFFRDEGSFLDPVEMGQRVEAAYNPDLEREGLPYLMRLRPAGEGEGRYLRLVLFDPKGVGVELGERVQAQGPLALVERGSQEALFLSGGVARFLEEEGRLDLNPAPGQVQLQEGKTRVWGRRLFYSNETGEARLEGPLRFIREGDKPLEGEAGGLTYNLDQDRLLLEEGVAFRQGERRVKAQRALLKEAEGFLYLLGGVEVEDPSGRLEGGRVRYRLSTGEAVVLGGVRGEFRRSPP